MSDFRAYVEQHQTRMMHHAAKAVAASNEWRQRDADLARKFEAERLDRFEIAQRKAADPDLGDAWSAFSFHATKAGLHSNVLQGLAAARAVLAADVDDPTGFGYSRDDAPVGEPLRAGVEGYQVGTRRPMSTPDRAAQPGMPTIRTARSGAQQGAAGTGACLPHPTRGGAAA